MVGWSVIGQYGVYVEVPKGFLIFVESDGELTRFECSFGRERVRAIGYSRCTDLFQLGGDSKGLVWLLHVHALLVSREVLDDPVQNLAKLPTIPDSPPKYLPRWSQPERLASPKPLFSDLPRSARRQRRSSRDHEAYRSSSGGPRYAGPDHDWNGLGQRRHVFRRDGVWVLYTRHVMSARVGDALQVGRFGDDDSRGDKKLGAIGIRSGVGHGEEHRLLMFQGEGLICASELSKFATMGIPRYRPSN